MRWQYVLFLSTLWHYVGAVCPSGEQYNTCITKIEYACISSFNTCWENEISFNIVNTDGVTIHTSPGFNAGSFKTKPATDLNSCSTSFTINFFDSNNDGWHGAKISIYGTTNGNNDVLLKEITLTKEQGGRAQ